VAELGGEVSELDQLRAVQIETAATRRLLLGGPSF
jgi:hypothetical protein